jgi:hypothetical protein
VSELNFTASITLFPARVLPYLTNSESQSFHN